MLKGNSLVEMHLESVHEMDNMVQHLPNCVDCNQIKSTLLSERKIEYLQKNNQNNNGENCISSDCHAHLKSALESRQLYKSGMLPIENIDDTHLEDNASKVISIQFGNQTTKEEYSSSKWYNQWEVKCKEWLYRDKFNIEVLNFAKKLYFH